MKKYLHIYYEHKKIAVFDYLKTRKPRESEVVATLAVAFIERDSVNGSGAFVFDDDACRLALDEVSCGERPLSWALKNSISGF